MDLVFKIFVYSWLISIFFGIIVAVSYPLFKEEIDNKYELFIPLYNLFGLCYFNGYDEKFGLLFLIPFIITSPSKFSMCFAFGCTLVLISFLFYHGTKNYILKLFDKKRFTILFYLYAQYY